MQSLSGWVISFGQLPGIFLGTAEPPLAGQSSTYVGDCVCQVHQTCIFVGLPSVCIPTPLQHKNDVLQVKRESETEI